MPPAGGYKHYLAWSLNAHSHLTQGFFWHVGRMKAAKPIKSAQVEVVIIIVFDFLVIVVTSIIVACLVSKIIAIKIRFTTREEMFIS